MIHALDHLVLGAPSLDAALADYRLLLGQRGEESSFQLANVRLDLHTAKSAGCQGLRALAFAVADLDKAQRLLRQRALATTPAAEPGKVNIDPAATHGVRIGIVGGGPAPAQPPPLPIEAESAVSGLDHVVIRSPDPERAIALYAGRLGLSLRLDRSEPAWGARLIFFRCGDLIIEVAHDLKAGVSSAPDRLWGLSWRARDIAKAHARLRASGFEVSDIRAGRRPNTKVFTVKSRTAGVPTLVIGAETRQIVLPFHPLMDADA
jgi:catechol 2,3-dioxygenase-like lactoylglutathione lyase family enzyme